MKHYTVRDVSKVGVEFWIIPPFFKSQNYKLIFIMFYSNKFYLIQGHFFPISFSNFMEINQK